MARFALYAATLGAALLVLHALVFGPPSLVLSLGAFTAYVTLVMAGVTWMPLRMFADSLNHGPKDARGVALTFDDGPSPEHTPRILDLLDRAKMSATFFVIGKKAEKYPEIVREIVRRGHDVALHGYEHDRLVALRGAGRVTRDIERAIAVLEGITGVRPRLYRPPVGHTSPRVAKAAEDTDVELVGFSVRALDGLKNAKPDDVARRVIRGLDDGAIVLMHDAAERDDREPAAIQALPKVLEAMRERHLDAVKVATWLPETK